ncbi:MAG: exodeoxyribonuclease III [Alphaproteobacteria bacterium]|nr:exodeoxyribonuclease III [Alphaproteobacteria bacterium]
MKIASWNVNSIRVRMAAVLTWLAEAAPDVLLLQEIKAEDGTFPRLEFESLGYAVAIHGQKSYNGVAILSRLPMESVIMGLPGDPTDSQARYIEARINGQVLAASLYLPNGNPVDSDKFAYKLAWLDRLHRHAAATLRQWELPVVFGGDYNIIPSDADVYNPKAWADDALCRPESRSRFRALLHLGLTDAYRALNPAPGGYTFWDYKAGAWEKDRGLRIDHLLLSPQAADRLLACGIDKTPRGWDKPSDHVPVWCELMD